MSFSYFWLTMDLCFSSSCVNPFATLMYDCLLVLRAVVQSYVTPQIEKTQFYTLPEFIVFCFVVTGLKK